MILSKTLKFSLETCWNLKATLQVKSHHSQRPSETLYNQDKNYRGARKREKTKYEESPFHLKNMFLEKKKLDP